MNTYKIAAVCLYLASFGVLAFGVIYLYVGFTAGLMPYHLRYLGISSISQLAPDVAELFRTFILIIGFAFTAIGIAFLFLTKGILATPQNTLAWRIVMWMLPTLVPIIFVMMHLAMYTPWLVVAGMMVVAVAGLVMTRKK